MRINVLNFDWSSKKRSLQMKEERRQKEETTNGISPRLPNDAMITAYIPRNKQGTNFFGQPTSVYCY